jgi:hypothetical protein
MSHAIPKLQEYMQKYHLPLPEYDYVEIEDVHPKQYKCTCLVSLLDAPLSSTSTSKQKAKRKVAEMVLDAVTEIDVKSVEKLAKVTPTKKSKTMAQAKKPKSQIIYDWHNAMMNYAAQTGKEYKISSEVAHPEVIVRANFDGKTNEVKSNNKRNAQLLVAKIFFDELGLTHVDRVDMSQIMAEMKALLPESKHRVMGDLVECISKEPVDEDEKQEIEEYLKNKFVGVRVSFYDNEKLLFPASKDSNTSKSSGNFDQNFAAIAIQKLAPPSFNVRKISWYLESKTVLVHIQPFDESKGINGDIQKFKESIRQDFDLLVLVNQKRKSHLALQSLKEIAVDGFVEKEDIKSISTGHYFKANNYQEPVISLEGRVDHRDQHTFTIDSDTSIDLDDAFAVELQEKGMTLHVHIADVCALLPENSKEDNKALKQGFTYYGIAKQLPMIPEQLMFQASLLPMKDRMAWTVKMEISEDCQVTDYRIYRSVVRSKFRLSQKQVVKSIDAKADVTSVILKKMAEVSEKLKDYRLDEGGLANFTDENLGYQLVQEFMLLANRCVAEFCLERKIAIPYRHHAFPSDSEEFKKAFNAASFDKQDGLMPFLGKASYSVEKTSHDALSFVAYCHFTSPIRRYADLALQRQLAQLFNNDPIKNPKEMQHTVDAINQASQEADLQQGKMIYLEVLKKQFDQNDKPMTAVVTAIEDGNVILKSDNQKCSYYLEMLDFEKYGVGDQIKVKQLNKFNANSERFECYEI